MTSLKVERYTDITTFTSLVTPFLEEHEADHCLQLGLLGAMQQNLWPDRHLLAVTEHDRPILAAIQTPPHPMILSHTDAPEAIRALADELLMPAASEPPAMIMGPAAVTGQFAAHWRAAGRSTELADRERIYQLEQVSPVTGISGSARRAEPSDTELLIKWFTDFHLEALGEDPADVEANIKRRLKTASPITGLWIWTVNGEPVSFLGAGAPTRNGVRIGPVYTPPEQRQHGYASALVAHVSQELLDAGRRFCFLFTDLSNPTSNHIYKAIGYRKVVDINKVLLLGGNAR